PPRYPHSSPTRRSSDLRNRGNDEGAQRRERNDDRDHVADAIGMSIEERIERQGCRREERQQQGRPDASTDERRTRKECAGKAREDRKSTRLNSSHVKIS